MMEGMIKQTRALTFAGPGMATAPRALLGQALAEITPPGLKRFLLHPRRRRCQRERDHAGPRPPGRPPDR